MMRVLKATSRTQGAKPTDFCWTAEGEILCLPLVRCSQNRTVSGERCGCQESLVGVATRKSTTTFLVDDAPIAVGELRAMLTDSYVAAFGEMDDEIEERVEDSIATHRMAALLPLGAVCDLVDHILTVRA